MEKYFLPFVPHFIVRSTIIRSVFPGLLIVPLFETFRPLSPPPPFKHCSNKVYRCIAKPLIKR